MDASRGVAVIVTSKGLRDRLAKCDARLIFMDDVPSSPSPAATHAQRSKPENLAYVLAPAQGGYHVNGRETHGDSMIVDPWGVVLDHLPRGSGVVVAGVNPTYQQTVRKSLPALTHRTL